jgi:cysteine desulfurase/selenocysteine lyase
LIFTLNCSDSLNIGDQGRGEPGDHVITTGLDHNSILRPLNQLVADGVVADARARRSRTTGLVDPEAIAKARQAQHPADRVASCVERHRHDAGHRRDRSIVRENMPCSTAWTRRNRSATTRSTCRRSNIDLLAAPGHKGLLGPLGTGVLYIRPDGLRSRCEPCAKAEPAR